MDNMKLIIILFLYFVFPPLVSSQWHDQNWILGYDNDSNAGPSETMCVDFQTSPPKVTSQAYQLDFSSTNISVSDVNGEFLFYSNGIQIRDRFDNLMPGGDSLNWGEIAEANYMYGYTLPAGMLALPAPGSDHEYYLIHLRIELDPVHILIAPDLLFTLVDMDLNNGNGAVVEKNTLVQQTLRFDDPAAVKHANGRDWWVITPDYDVSKFYRFLLTPEGVQDTATQVIGFKPQEQDNGGLNVFSPDGSVFVDFDVRNGVRIMDFDRCSGLLSNHRLIEFPEPLPLGGGAAISPNSRFLYVCSRNHIFQFDLHAADIEASMDTVATYDGFLSPPPFPTSFYYMQLGPDGKIYVTHKTGAMHLHVIHFPDEKGETCDVRQHSLPLPEYKCAEWPIYPHYRLGPIDNSPCDTLGINNEPLAHFTCEADSNEPTTFRFTDNSFYKPTDWFWDFGDGLTENTRNPNHSFAEAGNFYVCLTVSNQYGDDTYCKELIIFEPSASKEVSPNIDFEISPNPTSDFVFLKCDNWDKMGEINWQLISQDGKMVFEKTLNINSAVTKIDLSNVINGIYFIKLTSGNNKVLYSGKLVVLK